jgi:5'-nucleotidase (lipoprotein e(P4) family)
MTHIIAKTLTLKNCLAIGLLAGLMACQTPQGPTDISEKPTTYLHGVKATAFFNAAIENKLVFEQTYAFAEWRLLENLKHLDRSGHPPAVILDIDETVLDNSPYELENIRLGRTYTPETWKAWTAKAIAQPLPGALKFCKFADSLGVQVFYISNREVDEQEATEANLIAAGFPQIVAGHVLLKSDTSDKTSRRSSVKDSHSVILLLGDNLRDFDEVFVRQPGAHGNHLLAQYRDTLYSHFIMFPNPMYGEWEKAMEAYLANPKSELIPEL